MEDSPLFMVPLEVRQLIYDYYLSILISDCERYLDELPWKERWSNAGLSNPKFKQQWETCFDKLPSGVALPSLMLTCKRAYAELRSDVHSATEFHITCVGTGYDPFVSFSNYGILRFQRLRRLSIVIKMSFYIHASGWSFIFESIARRTWVLEHLTIDWVVGSDPTIPGWETLENEERRFLQALKSITSLRTIRIYGKMPESYERGIEQVMNGRNVVIRKFPYQWWQPVR
ncbi:hypothetical protein F4680DRAFT_446469 [Xylaria scruposa]|nr:hypothetical protein F4680DRAFT_446469 [Xylaria scruposa]